MRYTAPIAALALAALPSGARAQDEERTGWKPELRPFVGATIPTGAQRHAVGTDILFGLQAAAELRPTFHLVGSLGVTATRTKLAVENHDVAILQYDAGVEFSRVDDLALGWQFRPFVGLGGGARSYFHMDDQLKDRTCLAAYAAGGTEFQIGNTALRAELRDNVFCYRSPVAGVESHTRNDIGIAFGLAYHFR